MNIPANKDCTFTELAPPVGVLYAQKGRTAPDAMRNRESPPRDGSRGRSRSAPRRRSPERLFPRSDLSAALALALPLRPPPALPPTRQPPPAQRLSEARRLAAAARARAQRLPEARRFTWWWFGVEGGGLIEVSPGWRSGSPKRGASPPRRERDGSPEQQRAKSPPPADRAERGVPTDKEP
ncbi:hypothetical protein T484DRAFT_1766964 [Baffinella frigidus]|nr:hypothetical protein T484DRAFT_1766964 [Cryptophyta sp. CCMP2293]